jgi:tRNA pseudouridine38-40 synthase
MPLYRITLAYDGTGYQGWQVQPDQPTIQGRLQECLEEMTGQAVNVVGAGRTDSGVHAQAQVAHFQLGSSIPPNGLLLGLNSLLPEDIRVLDSDFAPDGFHARYSALSKTYCYYLDRSPVSLPFRSRFTHHHPHPLDLPSMNRASEAFIGKKDFAAFCAAASEVKTTIRECTHSFLNENGNELVYEISANGFLHHMVRNIVGTLLEVGRGKLAPEDIDRLFESRDRRLSGPTAPARGLHLICVDY